MDYLVLHFSDSRLENFRWALFDSTNESSALAWQSATESELGTIAAEHRDPVILLIPQQCIYMVPVELPQKASRQVLSAIEYQIEDQLAQDIESQHFALGDTSANPIPVAVVDKAIMDRCLSLARSHSLRLSQILPELYLCPWTEGGVHLLQSDEGYLLRYGAHRGFKCRVDTLAAMLDLVRAEFEFDSILFYGEDEIPSLDGVQVERGDLNSTPNGLLNPSAIDFQQREYQLSSAWKAVAKGWRWIGVVFAVLILFGAYNKAIALNQLEHDLGEIRQQQYELLKPYLPAETTRDDNLKKLLIERLKNDQASQANQGFMRLLLDFTRARSQFGAVEIERIGYQNSRLNIDISSQQLKDIEALHRELVKGKVDARLENLSIKPERISARMVLQGSADG